MRSVPIWLRAALRYRMRVAPLRSPDIRWPRWGLNASEGIGEEAREADSEARRRVEYLGAAGGQRRRIQTAAKDGQATPRDDMAPDIESPRSRSSHCDAFVDQSPLCDASARSARAKECVLLSRAPDLRPAAPPSRVLGVRVAAKQMCSAGGGLRASIDIGLRRVASVGEVWSSSVCRKSASLRSSATTAVIGRHVATGPPQRALHIWPSFGIPTSHAG